MTTIDIHKGTLEGCVDKAQTQRVVVTHKEAPVALVLGVKGLDKEQLELGSSDKFWKLVRKWRTQKTVDRTKIERLANEKRRRAKEKQ